MFRQLFVLLAVLAQLSVSAWAAAELASPQQAEPLSMPVPEAPRSAWRGPDKRIDLEGYGEIKTAILNHDGSRIIVMATVAVDSHEERVAHLFEVDTELGVIVRRFAMPDGDGRFELTGIDIDPAGRVLAISGNRETPLRKPKDGHVAFGVPHETVSHWELHSYNLQTGGLWASLRQTFLVSEDQRPRWHIDQSGAYIWLFRWNKNGRRLERLEVNTLEPAVVYEAAQLKPFLESDNHVQTRRVNWVVTSDPQRLHVTYPDLAQPGDESTDESQPVGQHYERIDLADGRRLDRFHLSDRPRIFGDTFSRDGTRSVGIEDADGQIPDDGPARVWDLQDNKPVADISHPGLDIFKRPSFSRDGRYLHVNLSNRSRTVVVVWRLDMETMRWNWPRRVDFTHGFGTRTFSGDGRHMLAYNEVEKRKDRLLVFHFADAEQYNHETAMELDAQFAGEAEPPFPEPTHALNAPIPGEGMRGADFTVNIDKTWHVLRTALSPDGRRAFLATVETSPIQHGEHVYYGIKQGSRFAIQQIDLDTGKVLEPFVIPEPWARYNLDQHCLLAATSDGRALVASLYNQKPRPWMEVGKLKTSNDIVFFRWDMKTRELTHRKAFDDVGMMPWRMIAGRDAMLVMKSMSDGWAMERWDAEDLSATPLAAGSYSQDKPWPQRANVFASWRTAELDEDGGRFYLVLNRPGMGRGNNDRSRQYWLQYYDLATGAPDGLGIEFDHTSDMQASSLRGEHMLLSYYGDEKDGPHRLLRIWNVKQQRHDVEVNLDAYNFTGTGQLTDDGRYLFVSASNRKTGQFMTRLDLQTLEWSDLRSYKRDPPQGWASTPDGGRVVCPVDRSHSGEDAQPALAVYDFE